MLQGLGSDDVLIRRQEIIPDGTGPIFVSLIDHATNKFCLLLLLGHAIDVHISCDLWLVEQAAGCHSSVVSIKIHYAAATHVLCDPVAFLVQVCSHNDDLEHVILRTPEHRRKDLDFFLQDSLLGPLLAKYGLSNNTQVKLAVRPCVASIAFLRCILV
jgi:hypothetical protein